MSADKHESPLPEVGEIRALNGLSWTPWVVVTRVVPDSEDNTVVRFAVLDEMDDDVLTPVPDGLVEGLFKTVGNRLGRQEVAEVIDEDPDIDKRWCPPYRLDVIGEPGIQGCEYHNGGVVLG